MKKGFTLIELLVVISIVALLSTIGLTVYSVVLKNGRDAKRQSDIRQIQSALEQYFTDNLYYPIGSGASGMQTVLDNGGQFDNQVGNPAFIPGTTQLKIYMKSVPKDPESTGTQYRYEPSKSSAWLACNNLTDKCGFYCFYANMENTTSAVNLPESVCPTVIGGPYNFEATAP